jgi:nicotinate-nucleotide adenylyltransferase
MSDATAPIGILGGTFDPVHYGHLRLAEEAADRFGLAQVRLIPAALPNLRSAPRTSAEHRLAMVRLAVAGNARLEVDALELGRTGTSYTVDTLREVRATLGAVQSVCLILGADAFLRLPAWSRWLELFTLAHIVVAARPGYDLGSAVSQSPELEREWRARHNDGADLALAPGGTIRTLHIPLLEISATDIRARLAGGASVRYLTPQAVLGYIEAHHLYGT